MADHRSKTPHSPVKNKVIRSQKISNATFPTDTQSSSSYADEARDRTPQIPRSHTPGHLASKSQDRRRKPSDLTIRQRSQNIGPSPAFSSATTPKSPTAPHISDHHDASQAQAQQLLRERQDSSAGSSTGTSSRRPTNFRSTSAIASKPSTAAPAPAPAAGQNPKAVRVSSTSASTRTISSSRRTLLSHQHTPFPPLADPRTAPDVPAAPSSGMYWSRAPACGAPHTSLRAHTTTLIGSNVYVFGGCDSRACFNELYVLDADAFYWSRPHVVGDIPVPLRAMTCTAVGKKLVVFGGGDGPAYYNDVYVLDTVNFRWSRPRIVGDKVPSKRRAHTACLYKNGIYVFGGGDGVRALNDIWRLDVSDTNKMSWKMISAPLATEDMGPAKEHQRPKARGYHTANMVGSKLIIFGGSDGGECFNDVWVYDVDSHVWKAVSIPVTFRRLSHTATIVGSYLFVIGGHDGNEYSNDVLLLNLVTMQWDKRKVYGLPPSGRGYHGTVLYDSRLLMIGGFDGSEVFGDVWILELAVHAYYSQISHFSIEV
ncbi:conjugation with cellular fusion-related protein [Coniochaeta sp. PMI_546]|nr:conjugation with cellular fusion-related protein [Coniochaeta sp. PMI_546]